MNFPVFPLTFYASSVTDGSEIELQLFATFIQTEFWKMKVIVGGGVGSDVNENFVHTHA